MSELQRYHMIQDCIDVLKKKKKKVNYFEVGVQTGFCFFKIKADRKIAVDPHFIIKAKKKIKAYIKNLSNFNNKFFELTSDDFFEQKRDYIKKIGGIDVIFIDGLHLYEQVVKDIENSLKYLNKGGLILVHDCNPLSEPAAVRAYTSEEAAAMVGSHPQWINQWNGDVWKAIVKLRSERKDLDIRVINSDHGVGIIRLGQPEKAFSFKDGEMDGLTYSDLDKNRETFLNLKSPETFASFVNDLEKEL
ncbi:class I SAM-dependent methyltransferase [Mucilaginibacter ginsenosidivorax]|uniref:Class I SAM-dependent methyltransferase n=1 Tax=Mucilaginibacter ginsenosidivorax TaxID=862126 RepID=A0A5B8W1B3_9SPHI|nr:class I SAM-dependent methyltransferase [Mucilaginibacter ginsenosidivorax]QEC77634.1 class I SAM-dependent methyltransferase [Mucilaginibacter ginsenosidivorax]